MHHGAEDATAAEEAGDTRLRGPEAEFTSTFPWLVEASAMQGPLKSSFRLRKHRLSMAWQPQATMAAATPKAVEVRLGPWPLALCRRSRAWRNRAPHGTTPGSSKRRPRRPFWPIRTWRKACAARRCALLWQPRGCRYWSSTHGGRWLPACVAKVHDGLCFGVP